MLPVFESVAVSVAFRPTSSDPKLSDCGVSDTLAGELSPSSETNSSESELSDWISSAELRWPADCGVNEMPTVQAPPTARVPQLPFTVKSGVVSRPVTCSTAVPVLARVRF